VQLPKAVSIHKRSSEFGIPDEVSITLSVLIHAALQFFQRGRVQQHDRSVLDQLHNFPDVRAAAQETFGRGVNIELIRADSRPDSGMTLVTLHLMADGRRAASLVLYEGYNYGAGAIREALNMSMMQRVVVFLTFHRDVTTGRNRIMIYPGDSMPVDFGYHDEL
ncbi:hypothetical protein BGZ73_009220, partial [Actinomortierella ambigua]